MIAWCAGTHMVRLCATVACSPPRGRNAEQALHTDMFDALCEKAHGVNAAPRPRCPVHFAGALARCTLGDWPATPATGQVRSLPTQQPDPCGSPLARHNWRQLASRQSPADSGGAPIPPALPVEGASRSDCSRVSGRANARFLAGFRAQGEGRRARGEGRRGGAWAHRRQ